MLLLIDIGNTSTTIGFSYDNEIKDVVRLSTVVNGRGREEYAYILEGYIKDLKLQRPGGAAICSVVPDITPVIEQSLYTVFGVAPVVVSHEIRTGLSFLTRNTETVGADRIANAVAAHRLYRGDEIIIDFGTATTFCVVTEEGKFMGGAIMPGVGLSASILSERTAKLPAVELKPPQGAVGIDTEESIRSGIILGHAGAVERMIEEIKKETGKDYTVLATGGFADTVKSYIKTLDYVNPLLTMEGLKLIYEMNV